MSSGFAQRTLSLKRKGINLDDIDLTIIEEFTREARTSFREIGRKLGVTADTVIRRYNSYHCICCDTFETEDLIREIHGDSRIKVDIP